ncbi:MAG TPA: hypothetical protein VFJ82_15610 [Longimicrobium sp.]|nr:hypothetical protein [Longimicrobium sp.]
MYGTFRRMMAVAVLAVAAACGARDVTAPDHPLTARGGASFAMTFASSASSSAGQAQSVTGGVGSIDFSGTIQTSTPCWTLSAVNDAGRSIVVTVTATQTADICTQVITWHNYAGQLTGVPAGAQRVRVVHVLGGGRSVTAWDGTVTVM